MLILYFDLIELPVDDKPQQLWAETNNNTNVDKFSHLVTDLLGYLIKWHYLHRLKATIIKASTTNAVSSVWNDAQCLANATIDKWAI